MELEKANSDIREAMKTAGIRQWQVAHELKIHEVTLVQKLRFELSPEERAKVFAAVEQVKAKEEFKKLSYKQALALKQNEPETYKKLTGKD